MLSNGIHWTRPLGITPKQNYDGQMAFLNDIETLVQPANYYGRYTPLTTPLDVMAVVMVHLTAINMAGGEGCIVKYQLNVYDPDWLQLCVKPQCGQV